MSFQWPAALILLLLIPALIGLYVWMQKRRQRYAMRYASVSLIAQAVGPGPGIKRHIPAALYLCALTAMIIALARPVTTIPVLQNSGTIILTVDVSGSMQAEDVSPNRLEATKAAMHDFVERQPDGVKIGVVSFSDYGALVAPPTTDRSVVLAAISRLQTQRSTNMGGGLQVALDAIYEDLGEAAPDNGAKAANGAAATPTVGSANNPPPASIVLISDGESKIGPPPEEFAQEAAANGIKIYTIGIGTAAGANLRIQGQSVFTRLDEGVLRSIAETTNARYFNAQDAKDLHQIYDELDRERSFENKKTEVTFAFTAGALLISIVAGGLGLLWFNRLP